MNNDDIEGRAARLMDDAVHAVLTTIDEDGFPQSRTMWTAGMDDEDFTIYFVTGDGMAKVRQIRNNDKVNCFWTRVDEGTIGWDYVMIKGTATVSVDASLRHRLWNDMLASHFPGGPDDPNFVVLVVKPVELVIMDSREAKYPLESIRF